MPEFSTVVDHVTVSPADLSPLPSSSAKRAINSAAPAGSSGMENRVFGDVESRSRIVPSPFPRYRPFVAAVGCSTWKVKNPSDVTTERNRRHADPSPIEMPVIVLLVVDWAMGTHVPSIETMPVLPGVGYVTAPGASDSSDQ
ncbi:hypothetical protein [Curtobacterium sp. MCBD17_032]|uniref:hypothetical protein n=1 Tax=Curtobacterium sp. MCBD17_032 TaxID=2175659 RepID=UPI0011B5812B|nr:hypothetical protein [Curtobacterium sp. MCBD17_032]